MSDIVTPNEKSTGRQLDVAIIGGGIAGMYCAYRLSRQSERSSMALFEASGRLGGRICTTPVKNDRNETEFFAEFGPMRIEPQHQCLLRELLDYLEIKSPEGTNEDHPKEPCLVDFPAYASPVMGTEPTYVLIGEERDQQTPMDMMKLAFVRILGRLRLDKEGVEAKRFNSCISKFNDVMTRAVASRQPDWRDAFQQWLDGLEDEDYQSIREHAEINKVPLWQMGFWNLLSDALSNDAVNKIRDQGTFYHLIVENPNAAEWLVGWLRALKASGKLQGIHGGMNTIVCRLNDKLKQVEIDAHRKLINPKHKLIQLMPQEEGVLLTFRSPSGIVRYRANHVILALPKAPLEKLIVVNEEHFSKRVREALDSVFGFAMVKAFFVVKERWWEEKYRVNRYATRIPTRELHFWKSRLPGSRRGMIMVYTDRPGSAFWANYVGKRGSQEEPDEFPRRANGSPVPDAFADSQTRRLIKKFLQYLRQNEVNHVREEDVEWCGIRDWGREPYVGANHAWRPERKSWEELKVLSAFKLENGSGKIENIHVCGEAYSDYQGFIEGSLRSAAHVLHKIDPGLKTETPWLCNCGECKKRT